MLVDGCLVDDDETAKGFVLTCTSYTTSNCTIEAHKEDVRTSFFTRTARSVWSLNVRLCQTNGIFYLLIFVALFLSCSLPYHSLPSCYLSLTYFQFVPLFVQFLYRCFPSFFRSVFVRNSSSFRPFFVQVSCNFCPVFAQFSSILRPDLVLFLIQS